MRRRTRYKPVSTSPLTMVRIATGTAGKGSPVAGMGAAAGVGAGVLCVLTAGGAAIAAGVGPGLSDGPGVCVGAWVRYGVGETPGVCVGPGLRVGTGVGVRWGPA